MNFEKYDQLVRHAYAGVTAQSEWHMLLAELSHLLHCEQASLLISPGRESATYVLQSANTDPDFIADYERYYCSVDPGKTYVSRLKPAEWYVDEDWLSRADKDRSEFYQDFMKPHGFASNLCASLANDAGLLAGLSFQYGAAERDLHSRASSDGMSALLSHLCKAIELRLRFDKLAGQMALGQEVADRIASPVMVIDSRGAIVYANARAEQWFALTRSTTGNWTAAPLYGEIVQKAVRDLFGAEPKPITRFHARDKAGTRECRLIGLPLADGHPLAGEGAERMGVFILHDPSGTQANGAQLLAQVYGLSRAEERLVAKWAESGSLHGAARELKVSIDTVRTQIKNIFAKTGCSGQTDLARLLCQLGTLA